MSIVNLDLENKTLTVSLDLGPWTHEMETLYRALCAPLNRDFMVAALKLDWRTFTQQQRDAIAVRLSNSGLDLDANLDYFKRVITGI